MVTTSAPAPAGASVGTLEEPSLAATVQAAMRTEHRPRRSIQTT
jgi:hypothetical protein